MTLMTWARVSQLPDSEWQPERHPRSGAYFNSSPLGPRSREQQTTAGYLPALIGDKAFGGQVEENVSPERTPRQGCKISIAMRFANSEESRAAKWARIPEENPTNWEGLKDYSLRAKARGSLEECSSSFQFQWLLQKGYMGTALGSE